MFFTFSWFFLLFLLFLLQLNLFFMSFDQRVIITNRGSLSEMIIDRGDGGVSVDISLHKSKHISTDV